MAGKIRVGIIGFGSMGRACAYALKAKGIFKVFICEKNSHRRRQVKGFTVCQSISRLIASVRVVILAIKPQDVREFLVQNRSYFLKTKPLLISIAAGISTIWFEKRLGNFPVVRVMPNLAAQVRRSLSFISSGRFASQSDILTARKIFLSIGEVIMIKEAYLDRATGICGSGPGYVFYFMDSMYRGARKSGFSKKDSQKMIAETFLGAAMLVKAAKSEFKELVKQVASKKGTTEAALKVFKQHRVDQAIIKGMESACRRSRQISNRLK
jgi:pyrroline-5-carboxylate reductase